MTRDEERVLESLIEQDTALIADVSEQSAKPSQRLNGEDDIDDAGCVEGLLPEFADEALALKFTDLYGNDLRYTASWGRWGFWHSEVVHFGGLFWPTHGTANFYSGFERELESGGGSWTGEPRWSYSSRFVGNMSLG